MDLMEKLTILADSAKYDVACTSSGTYRAGDGVHLGNCVSAGICHSFSADGRCVSLLKVLMTNFCMYDCKYCVNRRSNDVPRAAFTPRELAQLTIGFYRRNYIEGLFLSSAVLRSPDDTMQRMIAALRILREEYGFAGYIHAKTIPGADPRLVRELGLLADRLSVNIELPSERSLSLLAPDKSRAGILGPMRQVRIGIEENRYELVRYRAAPKFAPAGQSTQMIVGASPETDYQILRLTQGLYRNYGLKRVFYSAYIPVVADRALPAPARRRPSARAPAVPGRLAAALLTALRRRSFCARRSRISSPYLDPKCSWRCAIWSSSCGCEPGSRQMLLRVPGIGAKSAARICAARRASRLTLADLKRIGVVLKRARHFILCADWGVRGTARGHARAGGRRAVGPAGLRLWL